MKRSHDYHCVVTNKLGNKDTRKFSMKIPKLIARGIKRLLENEWGEGFPTSEQIIDDCDLSLDEIHTVYQDGGLTVPELLNRNRKRYSKDGTGDHCGARLKANPGKNKRLDRRALSTKEDIASVILSQTVYERNDSDSLCDSELSEFLNRIYLNVITRVHYIIIAPHLMNYSIFIQY